jgi:hypothetical protein
VKSRREEGDDRRGCLVSERERECARKRAARSGLDGLSKRAWLGHERASVSARVGRTKRRKVARVDDFCFSFSKI